MATRKTSDAATVDDRAARIDKALAKAFVKKNANGGEDTVKIRVCAGTTCNATGRASAGRGARRGARRRAASPTR